MAITYTLIATTTLGSNTLAVNFTSIPQTYSDLVLISKSADSWTSGQTYFFKLRVNNNTGNNYYVGEVYQAATTTVSTSGFTNAGYASPRNATRANGDAWASNEIYFYDYTDTSKYKIFQWRGGPASTFSQSYAGMGIGSGNFVANTNAITEINLEAGAVYFNTGSTFSLYGILRA